METLPLQNRRESYALLKTARRIAERYLVPAPVVALYYSLRYRCVVSPSARIQLSKQISFGKGTVVKPFAVIQTQEARIVVGRQCAIGSFNHISTGVEEIRLGDSVRIGPSVTILGGSRDFRRRDLPILEQGSSHARVTIGNDVLIGANVVILPGCTIGSGAVVGAGSVVTIDVPPFAIVAGVPAQVIGERK